MKILILCGVAAAIVFGVLVLKFFQWLSSKDDEIAWMKDEPSCIQDFVEKYS